MDVTLQESSTYPAGPYVSSFFSELPTDVRFSKTHYQQISPHSSTEKASQGVHFVLDRLVSILKKHYGLFLSDPPPFSFTKSKAV
jgi:hypothetical protein